MNKQELSDYYFQKGYFFPIYNKHFKAYLLLKIGSPLERLIFVDKNLINTPNILINEFEKLGGK